MTWNRQFLRYATVGGAANIMGYLLYFLFTQTGASPVVAISILYPIMISLSFVLNRRWSFASKRSWLVPAVKYVISYAACYGLNVGLLALFSGRLGFPHLAVQALAIPVIATLLFLAQRYWVFAGSDNPVSPEEAQ